MLYRTPSSNACASSSLFSRSPCRTEQPHPTLTNPPFQHPTLIALRSDTQLTTHTLLAGTMGAADLLADVVHLHGQGTGCGGSSDEWEDDAASNPGTAPSEKEKVWTEEGAALNEV